MRLYALNFHFQLNSGIQSNIKSFYRVIFPRRNKGLWEFYFHSISLTCCIPLIPPLSFLLFCFSEVMAPLIPQWQVFDVLTLTDEFTANIVLFHLRRSFSPRFGDFKTSATRRIKIQLWCVTDRCSDINNVYYVKCNVNCVWCEICIISSIVGK